jgi:hypothetical protein
MTNVTDSFNRTDSASSLGTADSGQSWSQVAGTNGISSNQAYVVAATALAVVDASPPSTPSQHCGPDPCIRLGGQHALHLLTHVNSTLSLAKHDSYARFLDATASLASLLIAHTTAVAEGFNRHARALELELGQHPPVMHAH